MPEDEAQAAFSRCNLTGSRVAGRLFEISAHGELAEGGSGSGHWRRVEAASPQASLVPAQPKFIDARLSRPEKVYVRWIGESSLGSLAACYRRCPRS